MLRSSGAASVLIPALILALGLGLASPPPAAGQAVAPDIDELKKTAVKVFLDCDSCDLDYIKTEITFVNYVRDRLEAQVHVLITTQATGSGGREYTVTFIGQNECRDLTDIQKYFSAQSDTEDDVRRGLVRTLKLGLMSYVGRTPIACRIAVDYTKPGASGPVRDRWNSWVFGLTGSGYFSGESTYMSRMVDFSFSANRVTLGSKVKLGLSVDNSKQRYEIEDATITGKSSSWSRRAVSTSRASASTGRRGVSSRSNPRFTATSTSGVSVAPAVEYNFFPYSQSTRRQLRALYTLSLNPVKYRELTVFGKLRETLLKEELSLTLDLREKFGTVSLSVEGSNYFNDLSKYRVDTFSIVNLRLYKGLSVYVIGGYSWYHNSQLSLLGREPTYEEQLLRLRELPMNSNYFAAVGFQFQFGSIFTNVINPRFGSTGGGGMSISIH